MLIRLHYFKEFVLLLDARVDDLRVKFLRSVRKVAPVRVDSPCLVLQVPHVKVGVALFKHLRTDGATRVQLQSAYVVQFAPLQNLMQLKSIETTLALFRAVC